MRILKDVSALNEVYAYRNDRDKKIYFIQILNHYKRIIIIIIYHYYYYLSFLLLFIIIIGFFLAFYRSEF
jgi:hypothetical protein